MFLFSQAKKIRSAKIERSDFLHISENPAEIEKFHKIRSAKIERSDFLHISENPAECKKPLRSIFALRKLADMSLFSIKFFYTSIKK